MGGRERLDRIMELGSTIKLEFESEVPVFLEYYTVRADGDDVHFLADPYRIYKRLLADDPADVLTCTPEAPPSDPEPDDQPTIDTESDVGP